MSASLTICNVQPDVQAVIKKFRFAKVEQTRAIIFKIDKETRAVTVDERLEECSMSDVVEELPEHMPRFILVSYRREHKDGRVNFPLALVFHSPPGASPELRMLYAGSLNNMAAEVGVAHTIEVRDIDEFDDEYLLQRLTK